jgi:hypothetical protein
MRRNVKGSIFLGGCNFRKGKYLSFCRDDDLNPKAGSSSLRPRYQQPQLTQELRQERNHCAGACGEDGAGTVPVKARLDRIARQASAVTDHKPSFTILASGEGFVTPEYFPSNADRRSRSDNPTVAIQRSILTDQEYQ